MAQILMTKMHHYSHPPVTQWMKKVRLLPLCNTPVVSILPYASAYTGNVIERVPSPTIYMMGSISLMSVRTNILTGLVLAGRWTFKLVALKMKNKSFY